FDPNVYLSSDFGVCKASEVLCLVSEKSQSGCICLLACGQPSQGIAKKSQGYRPVTRYTANQGVENHQCVSHTKSPPPFTALQTQIEQLRRLQSSCDLLRKISRAALRTKRIQSRLMDLSKSSVYVKELEHCSRVSIWRLFAHSSHRKGSFSKSR
ncbi:hypothetical protein T265_15535, partial [Opisthorchis viverrini]